MKFPKPSAAVLAGRARRGARAGRIREDLEWFADEVAAEVSMTMHQRMILATEYLRDKVVKNISRPVTKGRGPRGGYRVTDRSVKGEFPKAETERLQGDIFKHVRPAGRDSYDGFVGTTLSYGVILETSKRLDRSFLKRTLREELPIIRKMLGTPMR